MAKEYIERNALLAEYDRVHIGVPGGARKLIEEAPCADAVEVVRCKDCEHRGNKVFPAKWCIFNARLVSEEDFCSHGRKKERDSDTGNIL